jgi:hypothetical protein
MPVPELRTAFRGVIGGCWSYFVLGATYLIIAPTVVRGGFHLRYLLPLPIALTLNIGVAFIPVDGSTLGIVSIGLCGLGLAFLVGEIALAAPFYATDEHKALEQSFGPATIAISFLFFGLVAAYDTLTHLNPSPFIGLLLPIGSAVIRVLAIFALVRSFHTLYWEPKQAFLAQLPQSAQSQANVVPPLIGDIEAPYSYIAALFALIIGNAASVSTLVEAMLAPESMAWLLCLAVSSVLEVLTRTGMMHRIEVTIAVRLAAQSGLQWPMHVVHANALELVYLHALGGTGYVAPTMALCIGCLRAVTFGDAGAIVWLDASPTVRALAAGAVCLWIPRERDRVDFGKVGDAAQHFELSVSFAAGHPLSNTAFRDFYLKGYIFAFCAGGAFIYGIFIVFLGPAFVTGVCLDFAPATDAWVLHAPECVNAIAIAAGLTNGTDAR